MLFDFRILCGFHVRYDEHTFKEEVIIDEKTGKCVTYSNIHYGVSSGMWQRGHSRKQRSTTCRHRLKLLQPRR